jgi:ferredoxin--NADP+ reductase
MRKIVDKRHLSKDVVQLIIEAPEIARKRQAGHFVIVRIGEKGERIPLTISSANPLEGTITLVVQKVGVTSHKLANLGINDHVTDVVGPLGHPTRIHKAGTILCAGGGVGIAPLLPIVEAMHEAGNKIISVLAARNKELVILEKEVAGYSDEIIIMTDDGSYGHKGLITEGMEHVISSRKIDLAITIGPAVMMKYTALLTRKYNVPTIASLNTIMVDGTGMCGACRVTVNGETKFVCVDGPEFDAHQVDFDELIMRLGSYREEEVIAHQ